MNGEHPQPNPREKEIFWGALKLSTPEEIAKYLYQECGGNQNLRASVEALLNNHKKDDLFEHPPEKIGEKVGDAIDDYKLLEEVGEGGCGVVFRTEQQKPFHRQVALKVIKQNVATEQIKKRFQAEIQALASLEHSFIARVYNAGSTKNGLPYFTMEFVDGKSITVYADKLRLTISERLELFGKVCKAVQFAHEKGFVHRDIKPSNILVCEESGEHVPKVIDFGIAKAIVDEIFNTFATKTGQIVGTPAYMSPEQAGLKNEEVNAKSDIYSLGVLLHELLVGHQPFDFTGMTWDDASKTIREENPKLPSEWVNTEANKSYFKIAKQRHLRPSKLKKMLRGELDRIVMKCLEKTPDMRYKSVEDIDVDIQNFIESIENQKFYTSVWVTAAVLALVVGTFTAIYLNSPKKPVTPPPDDTTATGLLTNLVYPKLYGKDTNYLFTHQTIIGRQVWAWLTQQPWFKDKGIGNITRQLNGGAQQTLIIEYDTLNGIEKIAAVFWKEGGILKFHDVHIFEMMGDNIDMDLSVKILDPYRFETNYCQRNPGKNSQITNLFPVSVSEKSHQP